MPSVKVEWKCTQFDWQDITSKVMFPLRFYYCKRNIDYSPVLTETNLACKYSLNPSSSLQSYFRDWSLRVRIFVDNVIRYTGFVDNITYIKEKMEWRLDIKSYLHKLTEQDASTSIYSFIGTGSPTQRQYYTDGNGKTYVQMLWLLYKLFQMQGLGLDISDLENQLWKAYDGTYYLTDVYYRHIKFDIQMLQCWNQPDTANRVLLTNSSKDYADNKLNAFEMLQHICASFGISITPNGDMSYKLWRLQSVANRNYDFTAVKTYSYDKTIQQADFTSSEGYTVIHTLGSDENSGAIIPSQEREYYYSTTETKVPRDVKTVVLGEGRYQIELVKHFMVIMENGDNTPPIHNLNNSVNPFDVAKFIALPKYQLPSIESANIEVDFSKPCILENEFVYDKNSYLCKVKQETTIVSS